MVDETGSEAAAAGTSWHSGLDADLKGHVANRGWDKLDATTALAQAVKAHREAEKLIGVPAEQVLRLPKDTNDKEGYARIFKAIGVPETKEGYDFTGVKLSNGTELDKTVIEGLRELSANLHLPKAEATELARWAAKSIEADESAEATEYATKLAAEKDTLAKNWGSNANTNLIVAQNAAAKLGVDAEGMAALEKTAGYAKVMEMFRQIGTRIGEDKFVSNNGRSGGDAMTAEGAQQKLDMLCKDEAWMAKFDAGDSVAKQEFDNLTKIVTMARIGTR